jgi:Protein tyrosine and serine/threonine kinase
LNLSSKFELAVKTPLPFDTDGLCSFELAVATPLPFDTDGLCSFELAVATPLPVNTGECFSEAESWPTAAISPIDEKRVEQLVRALARSSKGDWLIKGYNIKSSEVLGLGGFGVVYAGFCAISKKHVRLSNYQVAVKVIKTNRQNRDLIINESKIHQKFEHRNIVEFIDCGFVSQLYTVVSLVTELT